MQILKNWDGIDLTKKDDRRKLSEALQFFLSLPSAFIPPKYQGNDPISKKFQEKRKVIRSAMEMRAFATLDDFPATSKEVMEKLHVLPVYDNGFESIFNFRDYTGSRRDGFSIASTRSGLTFKKIKTGEKLKVYQMSGDQDFIYFDYYGGALGWDRKLFDNQDWWGLEDNAIEFRNEAYRIRSATFYALIEAVAGTKVDIGWQLPTPAGLANTDPIYMAVRDANTLNYAAQTIILACAAKKYPVTPDTTLVVLNPLQLRDRVRRALNVAPTLLSANPIPQIGYNFQQITTTMLAVTDHYWVCIPKLAAVAGDRMNLTVFSDFDILSYTDTSAGWMAFGGAIADTDQFERCDII